MTVVVVGVDGSEGSVEAIRVAAEEARLRGAELRAVNAWHIPPAVYGAGWAPAPVDLDEYRKFGESALGQSIERPARPRLASRSRRSRARGTLPTCCWTKRRTPTC